MIIRSRGCILGVTPHAGGHHRRSQDHPSLNPMCTGTPIPTQFPCMCHATLHRSHATCVSIQTTRDAPRQLPNLHAGHGGVREVLHVLQQLLHQDYPHNVLPVAATVHLRGGG